MARYSTILLDRPRPGVQRVTLNRPEKRNALSNAMRSELVEALESGDRDPELRVSILRAGSKLQGLATHQRSVQAFLENIAASMKQAFDEPKGG